MYYNNMNEILTRYLVAMNSIGEESLTWRAHDLHVAIALWRSHHYLITTEK